MEYSTMPTSALLARVIGDRAVKLHFTGSLGPLFVVGEAPPEELLPLLAARELLLRWLAEELQTRDVFDSPVAVKQYLILAFAGQEYESFVTLFLDAQHRLIEAEELFRGTLTQTSVYPREIARRALFWNAAAVLLAHNHPSGVAEPSRADEFLTKSVKESLALVDVRVIDHLVIAANQAVSMAERGLL